MLLVQAAGNSKRNIDGYDNYPNPLFLNSDSLAPNWIMVGASDTLGRAADFSNYGAHAVDIFAPGVAIYSTIPDVNNYAAYDGTSMASPVVAGTAALLRSYFPKLTAIEIKKILEQSAYIPNAKGLQPGTSNEVPLKMLCKTGGIVNAFNAVKMAYAHNK